MGIKIKCKLEYNRAVNLLFILLLSFIGCTSYSTIHIEVVKPAKIAIPANITDVSFLNACLLSNGKEISNPGQKARYQTDSIVSCYLLNEVAAIVNESPRFNSCKYHKGLLFKDHSKLLSPMTWDPIESICYNDSTNAVLSIEAINLKDTMIWRKYFDGYNSYSERNFALVCSTLWRMYDFNIQQVTDTKRFVDTVYINEFSSEDDYARSLRYPKSREWLAYVLTKELAEKIAGRFAPYWIKVQRDYFDNGNDEMMIASNLAKNDDWKKAAQVWQKNVENENKKIAAAACYNMALACEVQGRLDLCQVWLEKSMAIFPYDIAKNYMAVLKYRLKEEELLNEQFGVGTK